MRSVLALDGEDYQKHSAVIAKFSQKYLKTEIFPKEYGKLIANASLIRNRGDYEDFYLCSMNDTEKLLTDADNFLQTITIYLQMKYRQN